MNQLTVDQFYLYLCDIYNNNKYKIMCYGKYNTIEYLKFPSSFSFQQQKIIIIDSSATYNKEETAAILLLTGSPKVNLNRVVSELKPPFIILKYLFAD